MHFACFHVIKAPVRAYAIRYIRYLAASDSERIAVNAFGQFFVLRHATIGLEGVNVGAACVEVALMKMPTPQT